MYHGTGLEFIRVLQIAYPNSHVLALIRSDADGNAASVVTTMTAVHLTCKVVQVEPTEKPRRIGFIRPE